MDSNIKHLTSTIEKELAASLENYLFEPNDATTKNAIVDNVTQYLDKIKSQRGIGDFEVVCDDRNNLPDGYDIERSLLHNLPEKILENHIIEDDQNETRLLYYDTIYRTFDKQQNKIISYFEEENFALVDSNSLTVDILLKPVKSVDYVIMNFKLG